jgi:prolyl-tRNA synthetase
VNLIPSNRLLQAEADSGNIGGSKSHEYHLISPVGEDTLLTCKGCGYTANEELAEGIYNKTHDVDSTSINDHEKVLQVLGLRPQLTNQIQVATLSYSAQDTSKDGNKIQGSVAIITPSQRPANLLKVHSTLGKYLEANNIIHDRATLEFTSLSTEQWLTKKKSEHNDVHVFLDDAVTKATDHPSSSSLIVHEPRHFRLAAASDGCQNCDHGALESTKAIEVAHTFYLGTKYSSILGCTFLQDGRPTPAEMGCYGIGISRLLASVAESRTDDRGLVWPSSIAPYKLCLITTDDKRDAFKSLATQLYDQINDTHTWRNNVVLDDRRTGFGRKMTDAEMVGYPWIVVVGRKAFQEENPMVEIHQRRLNEPNLKIDMPLEALGQWLADKQHSPLHT